MRDQRLHPWPVTEDGDGGDHQLARSLRVEGQRAERKR